MLCPDGNAVSPADKKFDPQELEALARELVGPIITEAQRARQSGTRKALARQPEASNSLM